MKTRTLLSGLILLALFTAGTITIALANGETPASPPLPPAKQTFVALEELHQKAAPVNSSSDKVGRGAMGLAAGKTVSCPHPPQTTRVVPFKLGPFKGGHYLVNVAIARSNEGIYYDIWAGAPDDAPQQGLMRVLKEDPDPCMNTFAGKPVSSMKDYLTSLGPLTITQIVGDSVDYILPDGSSGSFNYVTGTFDPNTQPGAAAP